MTSEASEIIPLTSTTSSSTIASSALAHSSGGASTVMETHDSITASVTASAVGQSGSQQNSPAKSKSGHHHRQSTPNSVQATASSNTPQSSASTTSSSQEFCLRWNNYQTNLTIVFDQLLQNESFVDVTLACDGHSIKAHKMVLSACSPYFQTLFVENPCQHPIIIMRDVKWSELKAIVEFMYKGEINVNQDQIGPLLHVAEMLKIRGLADVAPDQELNATSAGHPHPVLGDLTAIPTSYSKNNNNNTSTSNHNSNSKSSGNSSSKHSGNNISNNNNNNNEKSSSGHHHHNHGGGHHHGQHHQHSQQSNKKSMISARDWADVETMEANVAAAAGNHSGSSRGGDSGASSRHNQRKRKWHSAENNLTLDHCSPLLAGGGHETPDRHMDTDSPNHSLASPSTLATPNSMIQPPSTPTPMSNFSIPPPLESLGLSSLTHPDEMEIKPGIAEMIREEERAKLMENSHPWLGASTSSLADPSLASHSYASSSPSHSYQYQLQSMWQKCWNTNQNLIHHLRFRERGPLKSWRPETMAEAIFSVLKEGLSLSQAARKYDIPYPTFVLYANRVHNMLGPSIDGGTDLRPKGRGRPQRILLGIWPEEHIKNVIKSVVFRDAKDFKDDPAMQLAYGRHSPVFPFQDGAMNYSVPSAQSPMGNSDSLSPDAATAAAISAMAHGLRQQMQMAGVHPDMANFNLSPHCAALSVQPGDELAALAAAKLLDPKLNSPSEILSNGNISLTRLESPMRHETKSISPEHSPSRKMATSHNSSPNSELSISITTSNPSKSSRLKTNYPPNHNKSSSSLMGGHPHQHAEQHPDEDNNSIDSELEMTVEPAVNISVSGMAAYKTSRAFSSPRLADNLFQDDCTDLLISSSSANTNCSNSSSGKLNDSKSRSTSGLSNNNATSIIKVEPIVSECRGD